MSRLILVRHGRAAAGWGEDADPGLDDEGRTQAAAMADAVGPRGPLPIVVSPLRRTRETAAALERRWDTPARVEPAVGEIEAPTPDLAGRAAWLAGIMRDRWGALDESLQEWRLAVLDALRAVTEDTVVVTHFVAINVAVGEATGDDRVVCFAPDNCSRTILDVTPSGLTVVELGAEAVTRVQ